MSEQHQRPGTEFGQFTEVYEVVRSVELTGVDRGIYRIDILRQYDAPTGQAYQARYYRRSPATWLDLGLGWVREGSADGALNMAMGFLAQAIR